MKELDSKACDVVMLEIDGVLESADDLVAWSGGASGHEGIVGVVGNAGHFNDVLAVEFFELIFQILEFELVFSFWNEGHCVVSCFFVVIFTFFLIFFNRNRACTDFLVFVGKSGCVFGCVFLQLSDLQVFFVQKHRNTGAHYKIKYLL